MKYAALIKLIKDPHVSDELKEAALELEITKAQIKAVSDFYFKLTTSKETAGSRQSDGAGGLEPASSSDIIWEHGSK
jgi:hypothetical protein